MIKEIIYEYWEKELPELLSRDIETDSSNLINDIVGIRRCGKSTFPCQGTSITGHTHRFKSSRGHKKRQRD